MNPLKISKKLFVPICLLITLGGVIYSTPYRYATFLQKLIVAADCDKVICFYNEERYFHNLLLASGEGNTEAGRFYIQHMREKKGVYNRTSGEVEYQKNEQKIIPDHLINGVFYKKDYYSKLKQEMFDENHSRKIQTDRTNIDVNQEISNSSGDRFGLYSYNEKSNCWTWCRFDLVQLENGVYLKRMHGETNKVSILYRGCDEKIFDLKKYFSMNYEDIQTWALEEIAKKILYFPSEKKLFGAPLSYKKPVSLGGIREIHFVDVEDSDNCKELFVNSNGCNWVDEQNNVYAFQPEFGGQVLYLNGRRIYFIDSSVADRVNVTHPFIYCEKSFHLSRTFRPTYCVGFIVCEINYLTKETRETMRFLQ